MMKFKGAKTKVNKRIINKNQLSLFLLVESTFLILANFCCCV